MVYSVAIALHFYFFHLNVADGTSQSQTFPEQFDWKEGHCETQVGNGIQRYEAFNGCLFLYNYVNVSMTRVSSNKYILFHLLLFFS